MAKSDESGVLKANKLTTTIAPKPQDLEKAMTLRVVGSVLKASARDGLSMIQVTVGRRSFQRRERRKRYRPRSSNVALPVTGPSLAVSILTRSNLGPPRFLVTRDT